MNKQIETDFRPYKDQLRSAKRLKENLLGRDVIPLKAYKTISGLVFELEGIVRLQEESKQKGEET